MLTFDLKYAIGFLVLFIVEVIIALYVHDGLIRPYLGDFLAVIAVYLFFKIFFKITVSRAASIALGIAFFVEIGQYLQILKYLQMEENETAKIVMGNSFSWGDMLAYLLGTILVLIIENKRKE
jgi:glycopeptide antibiotics resistance protein